jgi:hypothetical protein
MILRQWARKDLERGDLNALRELSKRWNDPSPARLQRLKGAQLRLAACSMMEA